MEARLWCSCDVKASRVRVEIIRFTLLITITVALISVAVRHGDHHSSTRASHSGAPAASASSGPTSPPTSGGQAGGAGSGGTPTSGQEAGSQSSGSQGAGRTSGTSTNDQSVATLPHTGGAQVAQLAGLAALLIAAGSLSLTVSRRWVR